MHHTDQTPATAQPHADPGTGAGAQATTGADARAAKARYYLAQARYFDALARQYRAEAAMHKAEAEMHAEDPKASSDERQRLSAGCAAFALRADQLALVESAKAEGLREVVRREFPEHAPAEPSTGCNVTIVIEVERDRVREAVLQVMGPHQRRAERVWNRSGRGLWKCRDREWEEHVELLGHEVIDFMACLDFPSRIAAMLPRPAAEGRRDA